MFDWYRSLKKDGRRTFWACFGGYSLDAMDVQIFSFAMPVLIGLWGMSNTDAGVLASATLIFSAIGGWGAGLLADRIGRVRTLQITIVWFAVFTFLSGLTTSFEQLLVTRALQGLGFGGEWATGSVLIGEVVAARHRGKVGGIVQSGWGIGWGAAALLSTVFFLTLPEEWAWRLLFFVGLAPAFGAFMVRRLVPESPLYLKSRASRAPRPGMLAIFSPPYLATTVKGCLLALGLHGGYYAIITWLPTYLRTERHLSVLSTGGYLAVIIVGSLAGYWVSAYLNDGWGRRKTFLLYAVGSLVIAFSYMLIPISNGLMLVLGFPLGFFASGIYSGIGPLFTELYPTEVRGSGQGFCFNFGRGIAALFPILVGALSARVGLGTAIGLFASLAYGLVILMALILPETRGRALDEPGAAANGS
ncbi:MAG TPA: MFS transporter [Allosphingosinicella sp.]|jgi:MFS family permease